MIVGWFKYVRIEDVQAYLNAGWIDDGPCPGGHGYWSHLMKAPMCWKETNEGKPNPVNCR